MNYRYNGQLPEKPLKEKLLWFAFFSAIFIYNVVAVLISQSGEFFEGDEGFVGLDGKIISILFYVFLLFSIVQLVVLFKWNPKKKYNLAELPPRNSGNLSVMKYGIAEAMAIYGLTLFLMNGDFNHLILFSGLAIVGMFLSYPKE